MSFPERVVQQALNHVNETKGPRAKELVSRALLERTKLPTLEHLRNNSRAFFVLLAALSVHADRIGFYFEQSEKRPGINPFDPLEQADEFVAFFLYSWARGKPAFCATMPMHQQSSLNQNRVALNAPGVPALPGTL